MLIYISKLTFDMEKSFTLINNNIITEINIKKNKLKFNTYTYNDNAGQSKPVR